jgi:small subunit ribosomal protein S14
MANLIKRDHRKRVCFFENELQRIQYKACSEDMGLPIDLRKKARLKLTKMNNSSKVQIKTRCILTGRGKAIYRQFGISRIVLRQLGHQGLLPGLSKASW